MSCNKEYTPLSDVRFQNVVKVLPSDKKTKNEFSDLIHVHSQEID